VAGVRDRRIGRRFESRKYLCLLCLRVELIAALMVTCRSLSGPAIDVVQRDLHRVITTRFTKWASGNVSTTASSARMLRVRRVVP
jgi:hypothetical protein